MLDPAPGHIGDVQQPVDATQIDEGPEVGDVLDIAFANLTNLELLQDRALGHLTLFLEYEPARNDDVAATLVELDDLELQRLAHQALDRLRLTQRDLRARKERVDAKEIDDHPTLDLLHQAALDDFALLGRILDAIPDLDEIGPLLRQHDQPVLILQFLEEDVDLLTDLHGIDISKLLQGDDAFTLEADVDEDILVVHHQDAALEDFALFEVAHRVDVHVDQLLDLVFLGLLVPIHKTNARSR